MTDARTGLEVPMATGYGHAGAGGERARMRAADTDRDRVAGILGTAYSEGRLSKDEYDARLASALSARTYTDLDQVLADLPAGQAALANPAAGGSQIKRTGEQGDGLALAGLVLGWGAVILAVTLIVVMLVIAAATRGTMHMS